MREPEEIDVVEENGFKESGIRNAVGVVRKYVGQLGVPGLLVYNGVKASAAGIAAYTLRDGDISEKLNSGLLLGGITIVTSTTFWAAMAMVGHKIMKR